MERHRIRPTFSIPLKLGADEAAEVMRARLVDSDWAECTQSKGRCAEFFVHESERHMWSPHLTVQMDEAPEGTRLRGRFAPHPELWTLFVFLYFVVAFLSVMGLMMGFVQWQSGMKAWGFWGVYLGIPGLGLLYGISAMGQRLGSAQMVELKGRVEELVRGLEAQDPEGRV